METRYNIAPTEDIQVVLLENGANRLRHMRWWLIPSWVKEPGTEYLMFNARAESIEKSPAFRGPFKRQRCIIPASSFIEWKTKGGKKHPYDIKPVDQAFAFAGLWDHWGHGAEKIFSCTMLTTDAAPGFQHIHNRQPVMLPSDALGRWLDPDIEGHVLMDLLLPALPSPIKVVEIDQVINNSRHKSVPAQICQPIKISS